MVQESPLKILIYLTGGVHWMGGVQYTRNLIRAVSLLPVEERPELVLQIGRKNRNQGFEEEFSRYSHLIIDGPKKGRGKSGSILGELFRRVQRKLVGTEKPANILISDDCSVAFPAKGPNLPGPSKKVYWVPDFQYKHYPNFFSDEERKKRDIMYDKMFNEEGLLVLSSEAVKNDFLQFFPNYKEKRVRVLNFCTTLEDEDFQADPKEVCDRYNLPEKFVYLPNQMWQHKGFDTAFAALAILKQQGVELSLVCTGNTDDYRSVEHFTQLQNIIRQNGLESQIYILGLLPRKDQLQIFRRAALILQPSRFEGWSTTVEDARALGKQIVLSDIDVHREQNPPQGVFFATGNADDLAEQLMHVWENVSAGPVPELEVAGRETGRILSIAYARRFLEIMKYANSLHSDTGQHACLVGI